MESALVFHFMIVLVPVTLTYDHCPPTCQCDDVASHQYHHQQELTRILCTGGSIPHMEALKKDRLPKELVLDAYKTEESFEIRRNDIPTGINVKHLVVKGGVGSIFHQGAFQNLATSLVTLRVGNQVAFNTTLVFLFGLRHLQRLELAHNKQYWTRQPDTYVVSLFGNLGLRGLRHLGMSYCFIYKMEEAVFVGVENITSLDLSWNRMREVPHAIRTLSRLEVLDLGFNNIRTLYPGQFKTLAALQKLVLVGNEFARIEPETFRGLENTLYNLNLQMTGQVVFPTDALARLEALQFLNIGENPFTNLSAGSLKGNYCLHRLELHYAKVKFHPFMFDGQKNCIRELSMFKPNINYFPRELFASLEKLSVLEFKGAPLTSIWNTSLVGIKASTIDLSYIPLTYIAQGAFSGLDIPLNVTLTGTSITSLHFATGYPAGTFSMLTVEGSVQCDCDARGALVELGCSLSGTCLTPNSSSAVDLRSERARRLMTEQCSTAHIPLTCSSGVTRTVTCDLVLTCLFILRLGVYP